MAVVRPKLRAMEIGDLATWAAAVVALAAATVAFWQAREAKLSRQAAETQAAEAKKSRVAAEQQAQVAKDQAELMREDRDRRDAPTFAVDVSDSNIELGTLLDWRHDPLGARTTVDRGQSGRRRRARHLDHQNFHRCTPSWRGNALLQLRRRLHRIGHQYTSREHRARGRPQLEQPPHDRYPRAAVRADASLKQVGALSSRPQWRHATSGCAHVVSSARTRRMVAEDVREEMSTKRVMGAAELT